MQWELWETTTLKIKGREIMRSLIYEELYYDH